MALTISGLAKLLGFAESTVSKALNNRSDVSAQVKQAVLEAAKLHGYVPNPQARRLAMKTSNTIGVYLLNRFGRPVHEYFGYGFLGGIMEEAESMGKDVVLFSGGQGSKGNGYQGYVAQGRAKAVEGLIMIGLDPQDPDMESLANAPFPVVSLDTPIHGSPRGHISTNNAQGIEILTRMAYESSQTAPVYLGLRGHGYVAKERLGGYTRAMSSLGLPMDIHECPLSIAAARTWAHEYLSAKEGSARLSKPLAVVCASDLQALGLLQGGAEIGYACPQDLVITGFDNIPAAGYHQPSLTTWAQDPMAMGRLAVQELYNSTPHGQAIICPGHLVVGQSCPQRSFP